MNTHTLRWALTLKLLFSYCSLFTWVVNSTNEKNSFTTGGRLIWFLVVGSLTPNRLHSMIPAPGKKSAPRKNNPAAGNLPIQALWNFWGPGIYERTFFYFVSCPYYAFPHIIGRRRNINFFIVPIIVPSTDKFMGWWTNFLAGFCHLILLWKFFGLIFWLPEGIPLTN